MAVTREQFEAGMTYDAYKAQMTRNKEQVEQNEKDLQLKPDDVQAIRSLPSPLNVLALAEDWCGDVVANLPILGKLAQESNGKLNVRVLLRDLFQCLQAVRREAGGHHGDAAHAVFRKLLDGLVGIGL